MINKTLQRNLSILNNNSQSQSTSQPSGQGLMSRLQGLANTHYQSSFEGGVDRTRTYATTIGKTDNLWAPSRTPGNGLFDKILDRLPSLTKSGSFNKSVAAWQRAGSFNGLNGLAQGQGRISFLEAGVKANGTASFKKGALNANGQLEASATLVNADGSIRIGKGDFALDARGSAYVGVKAKANGELTIDPRQGIYAARVGGEAFAGAKAGAEANLKLSKYATVGARAEAWAGIGASFNAEAGFKNGRFQAKVSLGAALGIGAKFGFNIDIDFKGIANKVKDTVKKVVEAPVNAVKKVAEKVGSFVKKLKFW